jgi:hypothetical protein
MGRVRAVNRRLNTAALALGVILLAISPLALTLARAADYRSSATVTINSENESTAYLPDPERLITEPLAVEDVQRDVASDVEWFNAPDDLEEYITVRGAGPGEFVVTARGPTPKEARQLAEVTAGFLIEAAEASARFTQPLQLQRIRRALRREAEPSPEREELVRRRAEIGQSVREQQRIFVAEPSQGTMASERIGDRILGALPGSRPLRPNPVWAAVAGLALALALALWALVLSSRPTGSPSRS